MKALADLDSESSIQRTPHIVDECLELSHALGAGAVQTKLTAGTTTGWAGAQVV